MDTLPPSVSPFSLVMVVDTDNSQKKLENELRALLQGMSTNKDDSAKAVSGQVHGCKSQC